MFNNRLFEIEVLMTCENCLILTAVVIIVVPQSLKTGDQAFELRPISWFDVPAASHHLGRGKIDLCIFANLFSRVFLANLHHPFKVLLIHSELREVVGFFAPQNICILGLNSSVKVCAGNEFRFQIDFQCLTRIRFSSSP